MKTRLALVALAALPMFASAQVIANRATLNALLLSSTTDDFERYSIAAGTATVMSSPTLDSASIINGQGPNLVNPGARYSDPSNSNLQWNGDTYFALTTKTILSNGAGTIRIDYAGATQAMGLDAENFSGFGYTGSMQVWNGGTLVDTVNFNMSGNGGEFKFLGYQNNAGITHVVVTSPTYQWSPIIDDHTYGVVPEPATMISLGAGLAALAARRRRK